MVCGAVAAGMIGESGSSAGSSQRCCPSAGMVGSASLSPAQLSDDCNNRRDHGYQRQVGFISSVDGVWVDPGSCCEDEGRKKSGDGSVGKNETNMKTSQKELQAKRDDTEEKRE